MQPTTGIGNEPESFVDQGFKDVHFAMTFDNGQKEVKLDRGTLEKMCGSRSLNLNAVHVTNTTNHSEGVQTLVIKSNDERLPTLARQHHITASDGPSSISVQAAHAVITPGKHNQLAKPHVIVLTDGQPMTEQDHHRKLMQNYKWADLAGLSKEQLFDESQIIEATQEVDGEAVTRYAVPTAPKGPFSKLLASKTPDQRKKMLPRSSLVPVQIDGEDHWVLEKTDLDAGLDAFHQATCNHEVGGKSLRFIRGGDTDGKLVLQGVLKRDPHPDCVEHAHLEDTLSGLKKSAVAGSMTGELATSEPEMKQSAAAAAMFAAAGVKDAAAKSKKTGSLTVTRGLDFADQGDADVDGGAAAAIDIGPAEDV